MATYKPSQEILVSGTNIKTINSNSLLGSGNIAISGSGGYPRSVDLWHTDSVSTSGTAISTIKITTATLMWGHYAIQTPSSSTDKFTCTPFALEAGTYTFRVDGYVDNNRAKIDWYLDDVRFITQQNWNNAAALGVRKDVTGVTVSTSGSHVLRAEINGSDTTNYFMCLTRMSFIRTGD